VIRPTIPTIRDETAASGFLWRISEARKALDHAHAAVEGTAPRSIDYESPHKFTFARAEHFDRLTRIETVSEELRLIESAVDDRP
jgi:hypothetical protein